MSTSEVDSFQNTFIIPSSNTRAYIYTKGYFSKTLLPYNLTENKRYCEVKCLLPIDISNSSTICNKTWKIYWKSVSTSNFHTHLRKYHPSIPRSKEEKDRNRALNSLEGIYILIL